MRKHCKRCQTVREVGTVVTKQHVNLSGFKVWGCVCVDICRACGSDITDQEQDRLDKLFLAECQASIRAYAGQKGEG